MKNKKLPRNIATVLKSYQKVVEIDAKLILLTHIYITHSSGLIQALQ